ncbi:cyclin-domain-containing protein [Absidia repens]|uniref:Cyclin-domain-containing protein n=1 Tax=Absidia repens TaxID=90262 RepID=A0A1X2IFF3_9FUNG|nr:cyclin-domain-containing protein [Absidia repens]
MTTAHRFNDIAVTFMPAKTAAMTPLSSTFTSSPSLSSSSTATTMTPDTPTEQQSLNDIHDKHTHESAYVRSLVDMTVRTIDSIWPSSTVPHRLSSDKRTVDTGTFVKTILRLSRTRHSTLLIAIFYLFRIKPRLQKSISTSSLEDRRYLVCGRRMFLVALLLACKFQNDVTPKNNVWARASGLPVAQINYTERLFLGLLDYQLYISKESYEQWTALVEHHCESNKTSIPRPSYVYSGNNNNGIPTKGTVTATTTTIRPPLPLVSQENQRSVMHTDHHQPAGLLKKRRVHTNNGYYASEHSAVIHQLPTPPPTELNEFMDPLPPHPSKRKWSAA